MLVKCVQGVPDLSEFGDVYDLEFGLGSQQPPTTAIIKREFQRKICYHMSPHEVPKTKIFIDQDYQN